MAIVQHKYGTLSELLENPQNENVISISTDIGSIWKGSDHLTDRVIDASVVDGSLNIQKIDKSGNVSTDAIQLKFNFIEELEELEDSSALQVGDSYDTAFSKLNKIIEDNEYVTAAALTDHERRLRQTIDNVTEIQGMLDGGNLDVNANVEYYLTLQTTTGDAQNQSLIVTARGINDNSDSSVSWQELWDKGYRLCFLYKSKRKGRKKWKLYNIPSIWETVINEKYPWDDMRKVKIFTPIPQDNYGAASGTLLYDPFYAISRPSRPMNFLQDLIFYQDLRLAPDETNTFPDTFENNYPGEMSWPLGPTIDGFTQWTSTLEYDSQNTQSSYNVNNYINYFRDNWEENKDPIITMNLRYAPFWYFGRVKRFPRFESIIQPTGEMDFREKYCTMEFGIGLFNFSDAVDEETDCISTGYFYLNRLISNIAEFKLTRKKWTHEGTSTTFPSVLRWKLVI